MSGQEPSLQQYNESFLRELERLNPSQRKAVDHIEGPVLVIAGPGTGKTHILTSRIGRILLETDTQARNILCLTFTDAGVHAMRERLLKLIGPEAHRVHIYTFHSFCNNIIQDNLEVFGRHDLEPLSDLERIEIVRLIIDKLDVDHPLKRGKSFVYFYENQLHDLFKRMKKEDWQAAFVEQKIDEYLADLPNRKGFVYQRKHGPNKKGELKKAQIELATDKMERLRAAVRLFPLYQAALKQIRRYDYEDMILWVLRVFEENEALLNYYREQYLYFLVDEYQDTNGAQNAILQKLIGYWDNPNIFIVGDDDQSIFEFQGARLKNLTEFYHHYRQNLELVLLKDNYRSSQHILDTSRALISRNQKRIVNSLQELGIEKVLRAQSSDFAQTKVHPQIVTYPNRLHEESDIAGQIEKLHEQNFPLEEVAVIYARHKQARNIMTLLEKKGIPYNSRRKVNILDIPLLRNLRTFLEYLQMEFKRPHSGEHLLFRILHFDFLNIPPSDLTELSLFMGSFERDARPAWRQIIGDEKALSSLKLKNPASVIRVASLLDHLLGQLANLSLPAFIERLINRSGLLKQIIDHPEKIWLLQVVKSFFDFVRKETDRNPRIRLKRLLDVLKNMDDNRLAIELNKTIQAAEGVNLLTAHSAKGLEFRYVFLIDCVKDYWEPGKRGQAFRFSLPDTLTYSGEEDALEARRRLFYVAMTRAKEMLHISFSYQSIEGKDLQRAVFLEELCQGIGLEIAEKELPPAQLAEAHLLYLKEKEVARLSAPEKERIDDLLQGFALSVSALNRYLRCPLAFYYENILKVPTQFSEAASYGTAMHNALQRLFDKMLSSKQKRFPAAGAFVRIFEFEMKNLRGNFSAKEYERRLEMGRRNLREYYRQCLPTWHKQVKVELTIRNVEVEGVPITGTIDKLELYDQLKAGLVDYKTGRNDPARMRPPTKSNPHGGSYWRQLVFYKILYDNFDKSSREAGWGTISYLDPDAKGVFVNKTISYTTKDTETVKALIVDCYEKIMDQDFYEGCGEPACLWCEFVRNNVMPDSFSDRETEDLDD